MKLIHAFFIFSFLSFGALAEKLPLKDFFKDSSYRNVKISPTAKYLAITYDSGTQVKLAVLDREKNKIISGFEFGDYRQVQNFVWATPERLLIEHVRFEGYLDNRPKLKTLVAANADGSNRLELYEERTSGYRILDLIEDEPDKVLIGTYFWKDKGQIRPKKIDISSGKYKERYIADHPMNAQGIGTDNAGNLRIAFAYEEDKDDEFGKGELYLYYKKLNSETWLRFQPPELDPGEMIYPLGFNATNDIVYLSTTMNSPRSEVYSFNTETQEMKLVLNDDRVDVNGVIRDHNSAVVGFRWEPDYPKVHYLDKNEPTSKLYRSLFASFPDSQIYITSYANDGEEAVVHVSSDKLQGDFFLFNTKTFAAKFLASSRPQLDPKKMAEMKPIKVTARDGVELHGYLTLPTEKKESYPLIVNPHGGPHGPRDHWGFNPEIQFFANRGFAVLQINFRGSGGYGKDFEESGYMKWGLEMQDDVTDATLWAVEQGITTIDNICIYGGSYGGYASLMAVSKEPDLYQCAVGYVGVFDLNLMYEEGDIQKRDSGIKYLKRVLGDDEADLHSRSPVSFAEKGLIKADIFLVHGADDQRVPLEQMESLEKAFKKAGKKYKRLVKKREGHGFQKEKNKYELYEKLEKFFNKNLEHK